MKEILPHHSDIKSFEDIIVVKDDLTKCHQEL